MESFLNTASRTLEITVTAKSRLMDPTPMIGGVQGAVAKKGAVAS